MREIIFNIALFIVFSIAFSGLSGCSGSSNQQNSAANATPKTEANAPANLATGDRTASGKSSDYPPLASAVAQADIKNFDGTTFKVADKKGKVILLNLWATWCGPCRSEMPTLVRMQDEHRDKNFEIIGLNTDDEPVDKINAFAESMKLNYTLVWADTTLQNELLKISKFPGIPQSFLIDREGHLRGVFRGANPGDVKKMEELVAKVVDEQS